MAEDRAWAIATAGLKREGKLPAKGSMRRDKGSKGG